MKLKVPENSPVKLFFREAQLQPLSDIVRVLDIGREDLDIEVPDAENCFQVGMTVEEAVLSLPGAGKSGIKCVVRAVSSSRCNLLFEKVYPEKPLVDYLQQLESIEKVSQKTYKPVEDIGRELFTKYMEKQEEPKGPPRKKVLIVDDAIAVHDRFRPAFLESGLDVFQAVDGTEGIKKTLEVHPDIILMDVNMPRMNGIEAARIIRANPRISEIPICMFTTEGEKDCIVQAIRIGVKDYILKTSDAEVVIDRIKKIIGS